MKVPPLSAAFPPVRGRPGDRVTAAAVVAVSALVTLALTRDVSDVPVVVSPVLLALGLQR